MNYHRTVGVLAALLVCLILTGCPPGNGTPLQQTIKANAELAKVNRNFVEATITLQTNKTITVEQARPLLLVSQRIAKASQDILAITSKGTEATWAVDAPKIQALLTDVTPANLFANVGVSDQSLNTAISAVVSTLNLLIGAAR